MLNGSCQAPECNANATGTCAYAGGQNTLASGQASLAEGFNTVASEFASHSEGSDTSASGGSSHAEGYLTRAAGDASHAEGYHTLSSNWAAHVEGSASTASGGSSHAEGSGNQSAGDSSHAEGYVTTATGIAAHSEGYKNFASNWAAHSEGSGTNATGGSSHAEGSGSTAAGGSSHAQGYETAAIGEASHAEGYSTLAKSDYVHAEGRYSLAMQGTLYSIIGFDDTAKTLTLDDTAGLAMDDLITVKVNNSKAVEDIPIAAISGDVITLTTTETIGSSWNYVIKQDTGELYPIHAEGSNTIATGAHSHAEGDATRATGDGSHAEGMYTTARGNFSHAEGYETHANGRRSHTEGEETTARGGYSHAEGFDTKAFGDASHAEGWGTTASGYASHAEGEHTTASGNYSHAEGDHTTANGADSHAEGDHTSANGADSHAEGVYTTAKTDVVHAEGRYTLAMQGTLYSITAFDDTAKTLTLDDAAGLAVGDLITVKVNNSKAVEDMPIAAIVGNVIMLTTTETIGSSWRYVVKQDIGEQYPIHAEGSNTIATGAHSHAEGSYTTASGDAAHAEGYNTTAAGVASHVEGTNNTASGDYSHAEGDGTTASGWVSHAQGYSTLAKTDYVHAEGRYTLAMQGTLYTITAFDNTAKTLTLNNLWGLVVGDLITVKVYNSRAVEDIPIAAIVGNVMTLTTTETISASWNYVIKQDTGELYPIHVEGSNTIASGMYSHAEGDRTAASEDASHSEGSNTTASGYASHAEGVNTTASGYASHAEGVSTTAYQYVSHAEGVNTVADGFASHAEGQNTWTNGLPGAHIIGQNAGAIWPWSWHLANGLPSPGMTFLAAYFRGDTGAGACQGAFIPGGADYAEMFETIDGNPIDYGYFVTLTGDKVRTATDADQYILGVITARPTILGDAAELVWKDLYVKDEWGNVQYQEVTIPAQTGSDGIIISPERKETRAVINPQFDPEKEYIPRQLRPEWVAVGLMGKILVRDDGTCEVDAYCRPNVDGIATRTDHGYRVIKRTGPNQILVLFR